MRFAALLMMLFTLYISVTGQTVDRPESTKLDLHTLRQLSDPNYQHKDIHLFVKGDLKKIEKLTNKHDGHYKYGYGDLNAVVIPREKLDAYLREPTILQVQNGNVKVQPLVDTSIIINNVLPVQQGASPLSQPYTGKGVLVGIIDEGIYFDHPDFQNDDGTSRIRYIWDMNVTGSNPPQPYNYGEEWDWLDIDGGRCNHVEVVNSFGHGTNVAGIACGNGNALKDSSFNYIGMAPETDIIAVSVDRSGQFLAQIADAVDYIFKKADALGRPCVINISYGTYYGSRDGCDFASQMIDALLEEKNGRAVVAAAGNAGNVPYHLGYDVTADTAFSWFRFNPNAGAGDVYFSLWADTADFDSVSFAIGADDLSSLTFKGRTRFLTTVNYVIGTIRTDNLVDSQGTNVGTIRSLLTYECDGVYRLEFIIQPQVQSDVWRFETFGNGRFDIWSSSLQSNPNLNQADIAANVPSIADYPPVAKYKFPDNRKTMVSSYQNSDHVITVANYGTRDYYLDFNRDTFDTDEIKGDIYFTSSLGPTRDNRQKPDVSATGSTTISTGNLDNIALLLGSGQAFKVGRGGLHSRNGGTSMASPVVAGVVALYLEKNPTAGWCEIKEVITSTARTDNFTGTVPNDSWGYGKVDGFSAMQALTASGCTNPDALNYDPNAVCDDGTCILPIIGCMDSLATNFDPTANVDTGGCMYDTVSVEFFEENEGYVDFYPNPYQGQATILYRLPETTVGEVKIIISNTLGQVVDEISLNDRSGKLQYSLPKAEKGLYLYRLVDEQRAYGVRKLIVQ